MFFKIKKSYWAFLEAMPSKSFHRNGVHYRWIFGNKNIMDQQFSLCISSVLTATRIITANCRMWPIYNGTQNHLKRYTTQKLSRAIHSGNFCGKTISMRVSIEKKPYLMHASHTSCCSLCQWYNFVLIRSLSIRGNEIQVGCNEYRQEISLLFIGSKKIVWQEDGSLDNYDGRPCRSLLLKRRYNLSSWTSRPKLRQARVWVWRFSFCPSASFYAARKNVLVPNNNSINQLIFTFHCH